MRVRTLLRQFVGTAVLAILANMAMTSEAEACSCLVPTVESSYNSATDVVAAEIRREFVLGDRRYFVARVQRTYKGCLEPRDWIILTTHRDSATCGADLNARRHLINGRSAGRVFGLPALSISLCSYDVPVSALTEHDLEFLNGRTVCCGDECSCADGRPLVNCFVDPCQVAPACGDGQCVANYCGGCNAEFYDDFGYAVCQSECVEDGDCPSGEWCRQTESSATLPVPEYECVPFVGEGERCGGFRPPWTFEQCGEGLTCDLPDFVADAPGICRPSCSSDADCGEGNYCASDSTCKADGACDRDVDCNLPGNSYPHILCLGHGVCDRESNQCGWECGNPQCLDLFGYDFGPCDAVLGWAVVGGLCGEVSGCGSDFMLFSSETECRESCSGGR